MSGLTPLTADGKAAGKVLIISNGHGEDQIGAVLAARLMAHGPFGIAAFPLVGTGRAYEAAGIPLAFRGVDLPSGGFTRHSLRNLFRDALQGGITLTGRQIRAMKIAVRPIDLAVCVGDCLLILVARLFTRRPLVFLPTAKSDHIKPHWWFEVLLMRRHCLRVFPRDALTAASLARRGVRAEFAGNPMMDALEFKGGDLEDRSGARTIALLPGSREEAYGNLAEMAAAAAVLEDEAAAAGGGSFRYLVPLADRLQDERVRAALAPAGWIHVPAGPEEGARGVIGRLELARGTGGRIRLILTRGRFADVLAASDLVLGLAGTANEQAAGLGKPVVTFPGLGAQMTPGFVRAQQKLLGEAVCAVERDPRAVARAILAILGDEGKRERMARAGRERMGPPGGAARIAAGIAGLLPQEDSFSSHKDHQETPGK